VITKRAASLAIVVLFLITPPLCADSPERKPVTVPFDLLITKHMVLKVKINGKGPFRVIFDTGAPVSLLNAKTAKAAGVLGKDNKQPAFSLFGPVAPSKIQTLEIGALKAEGVPVIVMDHPTVGVISSLLGPIEGIIGFPFFARYKMTLDYQAKELTFEPSNFEPTDILTSLMTALLAKDKPETKFLAPAALWGFAVDKKAGDEEAGVIVTAVLPGGAAAKAGLQAGDRLLTLDGRWADSVQDCYVAAGYVTPGTQIQVRIKRGGKELELAVRPQSGF
jgi:hypothetical protein